MARALAIVLFASLATALAGAAVAAPRPDGVWAIISDQDNKPVALIRIRTLGDGEVQGVLTASLRGESPDRVCDKCTGDLHDKKIIGMRVLWGLKPDPDAALTWSGGSILDPDAGLTYQAKFVESADGRTLTVRGFVGIEALGRTQTWIRTR